MLSNKKIININIKGISFFWNPFLIIMKKLFLLILFCSVKTTFASFSMNKNIQEAYTHILELNFKEANILLDTEKENNSANGLILLCENYIDFLTILISDQEAYYKNLKPLKNKRIDIIAQKNNSNSPYYLYCQAEIYLQWAIVHLKFKDYQYAIHAFLKAYSLLEENQKKYPQFILNKKSLSFLDVLLSAVPSNYQWILNVTGFSRDVQQSTNFLNMLLNDTSASLYNVELICLTSFIQINILNDRIAMQQSLNYIGERYRDNLLLNYTAARLAHKLGLNDYVVEVLENRPNNSSLVKFYYLDYLQAMSYLYSLDFKKAKQKFEYFLANFKGVNYIKSANHKLAWIAFLQNDIEMKKVYFSRVINDGATLIDQDKVSLKNAKRNHISNIILLRSRLLYDGGYYSLAFSEINQIELSLLKSTINQIEYWYRLAQISSHLKKSTDIVISYYQKACSLGNESATYYIPMSLLQIALLYEKEEDYNNAMIYLKKCLEMSGFDYEKSIHMKANTILSRLISQS